MWLLVILFLPIAILLVVADEYAKNKANQKNKEQLSEAIQDLENEYNELNNLIYEIEKNSNEEENSKIDNSSYYDDTIPEEEIKKAIDNIENDELTANEIIFLKFMNNKEIDISFSPRWEFQYEIKPRVELGKLLKLKYLMHSNWYDNVKSATIKELKEVLKKENLKVSGNKQELIERVLGNVDKNVLVKTFNKGKYILTDKGNQAIKKNKSLLMLDKEKAGEKFAELTDYEYEFLKELGQIEEYARLKNNELSFKKGYKKNDILWSIYNMQKENMILGKNYGKAAIIYDRMFRICFEERKYLDALMFLLCSSYLEGYNTIKEIEEEDIFEMQEWFYINVSDIERRVKIIEKNTSIIANKDIDWFIINSIDKYLKTISKGNIRKAFKEKINKIFEGLK